MVKCFCFFVFFLIIVHLSVCRHICSLLVESQYDQYMALMFYVECFAAKNYNNKYNSLYGIMGSILNQVSGCHITVQLQYFFQ